MSAGSASVTITAGVTDDFVGTQYVYTHFRKPSGQTTAYGCSGPVSGDINNGEWICQIYVQQGDEAGIWQLTVVTLHDRVDNKATYYTSDLQALGFPTEFEVAYGP